MELSVVIAGTYFLYKKPKTNIINRYLVYFLWFTLIVDVLGNYPAIIYFTGFEYWSFIKGTGFEKNSWLYNVYTLISFSFFGYYFIAFVQNENLKKRLIITNGLYFLIGIIVFFVSDVFFIGDSIYTSIAGTVLLLFIIILFYFDLLQSNEVINLKFYLPIYMSIGVLVYFLCLTPIDIFSQYFNKINKMFINLKSNILLFSNIFMYSTFIIGFLVCAKKKKESF